MTTAVLAMAYGTPHGPKDVLEFYTDVRRGRPPSPEQLRDLERRYEAIGGISPLLERTLSQVSAIGRVLDETSPGEFSMFYAAKHADPKIEAAIETIATMGFTTLVGLVLAPHYSRLSVGEYIERARQAATERGMQAVFIERWGDDPALVDCLATRVREATDQIAPRASNVETVFSAHSLPERILAEGDRYPDEVAETARLVARQLGLDHFRTGWQSAGRTPEPWLGPDLLELFAQLRDEGFDGVVVCPAGFTSDHLEVLYDLDIEAGARARDLGIAFVRTRSLNDDPAIARLLARRIISVNEVLVPPLDPR